MIIIFTLFVMIIRRLFHRIAFQRKCKPIISGLSHLCICSFVCLFVFVFFLWLQVSLSLQRVVQTRGRGTSLYLSLCLRLFVLSRILACLDSQPNSTNIRNPDEIDDLVFYNPRDCGSIVENLQSCYN